ncbi:(+)-eremophilene synthase [Cladobotryum mycophilum]|uniref:Terpene synthase n=1 Tax=Cladobotryum mycophilum TaxID=491253 RepID=A0ABR0T429_9HYPO
MTEFIQYRLHQMAPRPKRITVLLPDMFQSFLKQAPAVNPHYQSVKVESEDWLNSFCSFGPKMRMKINKCDFSYFCAIAAPHAPPTEFRTLCDWGNWVFPYDDMFDNGELRDQPEEAKRVMDSLLIPMLGGELDRDRRRIVQVHDTVVERMSMESSPSTQQRFAKAMYGYCYGALKQVDYYAIGRAPTLEEMVLLRRESSGVRPLYHLVEYAHALKVPDEVFEDPTIIELEELGVDMVSISNDILSYRKEQLEGVPHNMVTICRMRGMLAQRAFDTVGKLLDSVYNQWNETETKVPSWGKKLTLRSESTLKESRLWSKLIYAGASNPNDTSGRTRTKLSKLDD